MTISGPNTLRCAELSGRLPISHGPGGHAADYHTAQGAMLQAQFDSGCVSFGSSALSLESVFSRHDGLRWRALG